MLEKTSVLIVEDDKIISLDLKFILDKAGYYVIDTVSSFEEALASAREKLPEIIIMDIILRGKGNGIDAALRIKQRYNIPIIFLSALSKDELPLSVEEYEDSYNFLVKPLNEEELLDTIRRIEKYELRKRYEENLNSSMRDRIKVSI
jgi:DNA-binding NtrC family response regulator